MSRSPFARLGLVAAATLSVCALLLLQLHQALAAATPLACGAHDAREENKQVAHRVFEEILSRGHYAVARELYAADFVNHGLHGNVDLATDQAAAKGWRDAMPDLTMKVERVVAEGDTVAVLWSGRGTNTGSFGGLPPTGRKVEGRGITLWRMEGGRIKEEWSEFDQAELLKQLGVEAGR